MLSLLVASLTASVGSKVPATRNDVIDDARADAIFATLKNPSSTISLRVACPLDQAYLLSLSLSSKRCDKKDGDIFTLPVPTRILRILLHRYTQSSSTSTTVVTANSNFHRHRQHNLLREAWFLKLVSFK